MPVRLNPWSLAAALALACAGGLFAIHAYRSRSQWTVADMVAALPHENSILAVADVAKLRDSGFLELIAGSPSIEELEYRTFTEETGFDYRSDLDRVAIVFADDSRYAVALGRFNWSRLNTYSIRNKGTCHNSFCEAPSGDFGRMVSYYAIRTNVLAFASAKGSGGAFRAQPNISPAHAWPESALWVRVPGAQFKDQRDLPKGTSMFATAISATSETVFRLDAAKAGGGAELNADMYCKDEQAAANLEKELTDATQLLRKLMARDKQAPDPANLTGVLGAGSFKRDKSVVNAHWPLDRTFLRALAGGNL